MLLLVFRQKNFGVDVDLGFAFSLRQQPSVDPTHCVAVYRWALSFFKKISQCKMPLLLINTKYMYDCKIIRRVKRRKLD